MTLAAPSRPRRLLAGAAAVALTTLASGTVLVTQAPAAHSLRCTIKGTDGPDRLVGTSGSDVICGLGGDDVLISGGGREDVLFGGDGDDRLESGSSTYTRLEGGGGNDRLVGGSGMDSLRGGAGRDVLSGGDSNDGLYGDAGDDTLDGQAGNDQLRWEPGADTIRGGTGRDQMTYDAPRKVTATLDGAGNDGTAGEHDNVANDVETVFGSVYDDVLTGNGNGNTLNGWNGDDLVTGGGGADTLLGEQDDDELHGGPGNDRITGGDGDDLLDGADGADVLKGAGGRTQSSEHNACDDDPADTVSRCAKDSAAPYWWADASPNRVAPGESVTFADVQTVDDAGVDSVQMATTLDGSPVPWCTGTMQVDQEGPGGTAAWVSKTCAVPADAAEGAYEVVLTATDRLGHTGTSDDGPRRLGFMVDSAASDEPTVVSDVTLSKPSYARGDNVRVTLRAQDDDGIGYVYVVLVPPGGGLGCDDMVASRTAGTMADGTWTFACKLPDDAALGTWSVDVDAGDTWGGGAFPRGVIGFEVTA